MRMDLLVDGLGRVRGCERVRAGAFEILRGDLDGVAVAIKRPGAGPADGTSFVAEHSVIFSRVFSAIGRAGKPGQAPAPAVILAAEAERIRGSAGAWNHAVLAAADVRRDASDPGVFGLVTPWHPGPTLAELAPEERRRLLPRMMPALWRGLSAAVHGDLHGGNLVLSPSRDRFALIDPAAFIVEHDRDVGDPFTRCSFTTHPRYYPLLPPYYAPDALLADPPSIAAHFDAFRWALSGCQRPGPGLIIGGPTDVFAAPLIGRSAPGPADLQALGVLYYEALTGEHPLFDDTFAAPGWIRALSIDGFREKDIGYEAALERLERPIVPPSDRAEGIDAAESAMAMALLELRVADLDALRRLAVAAAAVR